MTDITKKNIGVTFHKERCSFRIWAPLASTVQLLINGSTIVELEPREHGYWELDPAPISEDDLYRIVLDGRELPDPASMHQPQGVHGPSQAVKLGNMPPESKWRNIPLKDYIIYELHTGAFSQSGDFKGIGEKLDHLADLGVTAVELMPIAGFPGERNWGYDGVFPFAAQACYGGPKALQQLVSLCHSRGIAVVLDVVYNHFGPEGNYLAQFGPYLTGKYSTPWGMAVNFDDRGSHGVREYVIENAMMWFRDFGIDALRLDAVHAIKDSSAAHILQQLSSHARMLSERTGRPYHLIAECDLNDPRYLDPIGQNGLGMNGQWADEFHHALRVAAGEPRVGYYSDFTGLEHLAKAYREAYVYTGMFSEQRGSFFGKSALGRHGSQFIVFSQNHDQIGNRMLGERTTALFSFPMQKLLAAAVLTAPFVPLLFMGEEWGETSPFLYFIDHGDPELISAVRKGRSEEFAASHLQGSAPDPKAEDTFNRSKLNWKLLESPRHQAMLDFYREVIALRKSCPMLQSAELGNARTYHFEDARTLMIERKASGAQRGVLCLLNFSCAYQQLALPAHLSLGAKLLDSSEERWLGPVLAKEIPAETESKLALGPESFTAYTIFYD